MKTRRFLAVVVAGLLLVSTLALVGLLNVTAAPTEITSASQFKTITSGNYKLAADIDLTTISFTTIASFSGTIDGNGKTITTDKPIFATLEGEVKNLTVAGTRLAEVTLDITISCLRARRVHTQCDYAVGLCRE